LPGRRHQFHGVQLLEHAHKIELVPGFGQLAVFDLDDQSAGKFDRDAGSGKTEAVSPMSSGNGTSRHRAVIRGHRFFDLNMHIRIDIRELQPDPLKGFFVIYRISPAVHQPKGFDIVVQHLVDRGLVLVVPHFFKPAADKSFVLIVHNGIPRGS
jgi:hypothetical protein